MKKDELPPVVIPTVVLLSLMLCILLWQLTVLVLITHLLLGQAWFSQDREWAIVAVSVALSVFHALWGGGRIRQYQIAKKGRLEVMTISQAFMVVVIILLEGAFGTWLFTQGRG